jgi:hypothetical protein
VEAEGLPFNVHFRPGMVYEHIDLDLDEPVLKDVRVRRALVHAIDRQRLTHALFEGEQPPALHFVAPVDRWYTEDPDKLVIYEPSRRKAASLLEEAGWTLRNDGFRYDAAGNRLRLRLSTTAGNKNNFCGWNRRSKNSKSTRTCKGMNSLTTIVTNSTTSCFCCCCYLSYLITDYYDSGTTVATWISSRWSRCSATATAAAS